MDHPPGNEFQEFEWPESLVTGNDLLLENILSHLSFQELLNSSLINQRWLHYSRKELRRRKCLALVNRNRFPSCHKLRELNDVLENTPAENIPFSGLKFGANCHLDEDGNLMDCIQGHSSPDTFSGILSKCPLRVLHVIIETHTNCPTTKFIQHLFKTRAEEIEELLIGFNLCQGLTAFLGIANASNWLPNLKVLEISSQLTEEAFVDILNGAPNLREIWGCIKPEHFPLLVRTNKVNLVQKCELDNLDAVKIDICLEFAKCQPRLKSLCVSSRLLEKPAEAQKLLELLTLFLDTSAGTLRELQLEHLDLLLLSTLELRPLRKLKKLDLIYSSELEKCLGYFSLQMIDFPSPFPALESVQIRRSVIYESHVIVRAVKCLQLVLDKVGREGIYSCSSVRTLEVIGTFRKGDSLLAIPELFPAITSLNFRECPDLRPSLGLALGSNWPLESIALECREPSRRARKAVNALLCGISPEEWYHLQQDLDSVALHQFNYVPFENSLLKFENLKSLKIVLTTCRPGAYLDPMGTALISEITRGLILARFPGLQVEICRNLEDEHLKFKR